MENIPTLAGRVTPCAPGPGLADDGAHGVTRPTFETTLALVRELSERWPHRPAPNKLRCVPLKVYCAPPAPPVWQFNRALLLGIKC